MKRPVANYQPSAATLRRYGLLLDQYLGLVDHQRGECKICREKPPNGNLVIDHDHTSREIRGLLCQTCNFKVGHLDSINGQLEKFTAYLANGSGYFVPLAKKKTIVGHAKRWGNY